MREGKTKSWLSDNGRRRDGPTALGEGPEYSEEHLERAPLWFSSVSLEGKVDEGEQINDNKSAVHLQGSSRSSLATYLLLGLLYASLGFYFFTERAQMAEKSDLPANEVRVCYLPKK